MNLNLHNKRVMVTGAGQGIGFGIARGFVGEGARVAIAERELPRLKKAAAELKSGTLACPGDLTRPGAIKRALATVEKCWGGLDILILNLGSGKSVPNPDVAEWNRVLALNLVSGMETLQQAVPLLSRGNNPVVIFIGSIAGIEALGAPIAYGAAKAALLHAMKSSARLLAPRGNTRKHGRARQHLFPRWHLGQKTRREQKSGCRHAGRAGSPAAVGHN